MGEFARCAAIASAALERWPEAGVHFLLSRQAPYIARIPFAVTPLPSSATFHSSAVIDLMQAWRPDVVIFDNAGRSAQLKAARKLGARVVFISSRRRQRRRAFRLSWMRVLDEHWIAYPKLIAGDLNPLERVKHRLLRRPLIRYLDVIMARAARSSGSGAPAADSLAALRSDVVVIPGGGTGHPGAEDAARQFLRAAENLAAAGILTTFVGPAPDGHGGEPPGSPRVGQLACVAALPQADLGVLMRGARLVMVNGGSTLLQAIACGAPCLAAPIAGDQPERIRACVSAGVAVESAPLAAELEAKARQLLEDEPARTALAQRAAALELADGVEVALGALARWRRRG
jgi:glycosyltransferase involved in cell wall biosynthesis